MSIVAAELRGARKAYGSVTALGLGSIVLGGFYDGRVDGLLGLDGVNESSLVLVCVGVPPR